MPTFTHEIKRILTKNFAHNITIALALVISLASYLLLMQSDTAQNKRITLSNQPKVNNLPANQTNNNLSIYVDVSGAVLKPGVYSLKYGSRLIDALNAAKGLSDEADAYSFYKDVNRASLLTDQQKIYIPFEHDIHTPSLTESLTQMPSDLETININSASESDLDNLPGIGPVAVKKIIDNRPFTTIQSLVDLKILSKSVFDDLKNKLIL